MVPASTSRPASINGPEVSLFGSMLRSFKANTSGTNKRASGLSLFSNGHHEKIAEEPVSSRAPLSFENSRLVVQELRDWESLSLRELGLGETSPQSMEEQVLAPMTQAVSPRTTSLVLATMPRSTSLARGNDSGKLRSAPSPDTNTDFVYVSPSSIMTVDRRIFQPESSTPKEQQFGTTPRARTWSAPPPLSPSSLDAATLAANSPATDDIPMATSPVQVQDAQGMSVVSDSVLYDGGVSLFRDGPPSLVRKARTVVTTQSDVSKPETGVSRSRTLMDRERALDAEFATRSLNYNKRTSSLTLDRIFVDPQFIPPPPSHAPLQPDLQVAFTPAANPSNPITIPSSRATGSSNISPEDISKRLHLEFSPIDLSINVKIPSPQDQQQFKTLSISPAKNSPPKFLTMNLARSTQGVAEDLVDMKKWALEKDSDLELTESFAPSIASLGRKKSIKRSTSYKESYVAITAQPIAEKEPEPMPQMQTSPLSVADGPQEADPVPVAVSIVEQLEKAASTSQFLSLQIDSCQEPQHSLYPPKSPKSPKSPARSPSKHASLNWEDRFALPERVEVRREPDAAANIRVPVPAETDPRKASSPQWTPNPPFTANSPTSANIPARTSSTTPPFNQGKDAAKKEKKGWLGLFSNLLNPKKKNDSDWNPYPQNQLDLPPSRLAEEQETIIYSMSHGKLADIGRPLFQQVLISNFMMYILSVHASVTIQGRGPQRKRRRKKRRPRPFAPVVAPGVGLDPLEKTPDSDAASKPAGKKSSSSDEETPSADEWESDDSGEDMGIPRVMKRSASSPELYKTRSIPLVPLVSLIESHARVAPAGLNKAAGEEDEDDVPLGMLVGRKSTAADAFLHPVDTLKTRMQGQLTSKSVKYNGIWPSLGIILKEEGIRGLFGGFTASLLGSLLGQTVYFGAYEMTKRRMIDAEVNPEISYFVAGGFADIAASSLYVPSEVLKTRLQLQGRYNNPHSLSAHNYRNTYDAFITIYRKRGLGGLYYGWGATLLRDVPYSAIQFTIYETMKKFFIRVSCDGDPSRLSSGHDMFSGAVAGGIAGGLTTPLDVIKTYLQTQQRKPRPTSFLSTAPGEDLSKAQHVSYNGVFSALRGVYKTSGVAGLFSGVGVRMVWTSSQSMAMFFLYEYFVNASHW
ncbi:hypothetical protein HDV03_000715 [Kappamyces sp. JEL0829]|nr:hypothetical protein HDV03_000715 [Kappamyces sp. JEL0829]